MDFWDDHRRRREEILRPIREEVGYPVDDSNPDAFYDLSSDVVNDYISALESALVGTKMAVSAVARAMRPR